MNLSTTDLKAIKLLLGEALDEKMPGIIDERIDERVPPMLNRLEKRTTIKLDQLTLDVGQFSLETTGNFMDVTAHLDDLDGGLARLSEMTDNSRVELKKLRHRVGKWQTNQT